MALRTRKPTGAIPWPVILLEGGEKSGKTTALVMLSASPKVGRTAILFLGEVISDEYGAYPGARYEIIEHDGTFQSIIGQVEDARTEARRAFDAGEPPFVLGIDTASAEWELLKDWGSAKARRSPSHQRRLLEDPNADVKISTNIWNDVGAMHGRLMTLLLTFPGIVVLIARGKETALIGPDGNPVEGKKDYRVEGHKNLCFDVSVWIRMFRDKPAVVVGARSVHAGIRPGKDAPVQMAPDWSLEGLIFTTLRCDPKAGAVQQMVPLRTDVTAADIRDEALNPYTPPDRIVELWREARVRFPGEVLPNENNDDENLVAMLERVGAARRAEYSGMSAQAARPGRPPSPQGQRPAGNGGARRDPVLSGDEDPWQNPPPNTDPFGAPAADGNGQQHRIRPEDQGARQPTAPSGDDDQELVKDFYARLADTPLDGLGAMQREVGAAIRDRKVTVKTGGELTDSITARRKELTAEPVNA